MLMILLALLLAVPVLTPSSASAEPAECGDAVDNDGDGLTDYPEDPGCSDATDDAEMDPLPQCSDGVDNDGDGLRDFPEDTDCDDASDNAEGPAGCATYSSAASSSSSCWPTTLTIRFNRDRTSFTGTLFVAMDECARGAEVVLRQRRPGKDRALGSVLTSRRGRWRLPMSGAFSGRFYAEAVGRAIMRDEHTRIDCPGDRSVTIRVRSRG